MALFCYLFWYCFILFAFRARLGTARETSDSTASTFVYTFSPTQPPFVFSLRIQNTTGTLAFCLSGPAIKSWIAVGTGSEMVNSVMFIAYANGKDDGITLSPRLSHDEVEPGYSSILDSRMTIDDDEPGATVGNIYTVCARCANCTNWDHGSLNLSSRVQPFIFATGSGKQIDSTSLSASIPRHDHYGSFTMDMVQASSSGFVDAPRNITVNSGAALSGSVTSDHDGALIIHAVVMSLAFGLLMPLGVCFLRVLETVKWHGWNQAIATLLVIVGVGTGVYTSREYNKARSFSTGHQILGILIFIATLSQLGLGYFHHRQYKKHQRPTWAGRVHRYAGPAILVVGIVNGGIGLQFARASSGYIAVYSVSAMVFILVYTLLFVKRRNIFMYKLGES